MLALLVGCGSSASTDNGMPRSNVTCAPGAPGCSTTPNITPGDTTQPGNNGGSTVPMNGNMMGGTGAPASEGVPCDVAGVVSNNCTTCHAAVPRFSAPMSLMKLSDFQAMAKTMPTKHVYEVIPARINATVVAQRMPPASKSALAAADLQVLNNWVSTGVPGGTCMITDPGPGGGTVQTGGGAGEGGGTMTGGMPSGSGGSTNMPIDYNDDEMKCYQFLSHDPGDKMTPFTVSTTPDLYTNFMFMPPWQGMQYARSFKVVLGNNQVIHHWLFYKDSAAGTDGDVSASSGVHPDGQLLHGWAPGGDDLYFDYDVGEEMPSDVAFTLETHHNNTTGTAAPDASGVEVCVTPKVPKYNASLSWLGTDNINGTTATGTCMPTGTEPITILGATPHMHTKGTHMKVTIQRAGGMTEIFHDEDFDFANQHSYADKTIIMPGDSLTTTCTYNAPASFGERTTDEMCYFFTLYYPKLSLTNGNPVGTLIHGPNTCLE